MGVITPDRFNPIKAFCNVRLQQGVPLVDADINELDDIRKFEVRAFLKWFVGDGVPDGNDGFRIAPLPPAAGPPPNTKTNPGADDFVISAGVQLAAAGAGPVTTVASAALNEFAAHAYGRCIVDGLDVIISADTTYKTQPLHPSQSGATGLALEWGVPVIADIPALAASGDVIVYLDIWERPVAPSKDGSLIVPPLGTESCARLKREWAVRTAAGTILPAPPLGVPHHYYALAVIHRRIIGGIAQTIQPEDITDRREQRLLMPPSTLIPDVLGMSVTDYRQGHNRPATSLRNVLNALLRGELPATDEVPVTTDLNNDFVSYAFVLDQTGGVNAVWTSNRNQNQKQIFTARWTPSNPGAGFTGLAMLTSTDTTHVAPSAALLPNGDAIMAYSTAEFPLPGVPQAKVFFKHTSRFIDMAQMTTPSSLDGTTTVWQRAPFVVPTGNAAGGTVVFFFHESTPTPRWVYQRRAYTPAWDETSATWTDHAGQPLPNVSTAQASPAGSPPTSSGDFHAASDGAGHIWLAYRALDVAGMKPEFTAIQVAQLTVATNAITVMPHLLHLGASTTEQAPFVLADTSSAHVWVFWQSDKGIYTQQYQNGEPLGSTNLVPDTDAGTHANPCAVHDAAGTLWLFWESDRGGAGNRIWCNRFSKSANTWESARQVTGPTLPDTQPFALLGSNGNIWLFWRRALSDNNSDLYFKQLLTSI